MAASSSGLHAPADGGGGGVDMMLELSELRQMDKWKAMMSWVELNLATAARQALSYHLTTACQAMKQNGPGISLRHSGLDTEHKTPADGGGHLWHVELDIADAFEVGDGCRLQYRSLAFDSKRDAQKLSCVEMLCFLLVSAPSKVKLHTSNWVHGGRSIETLLGKAREIQQVRQLTPNALSFRCVVPGQQTPQAIIHQPMAVPDPRERFCAGGNVDDQLVIQTMRSLRCGKVYGPGEIPKAVGFELNMLLPRGGLLPFLKRHPALFEVQTDGTKTANGSLMYSFVVSPQINEAADVGAVGIQASRGGPSAPADGGQGGIVGTHIPPPGLGHGASMHGAVGSHAPPGIVHMSVLPVQVEMWTVQNVVQYLEYIELAHLEPAIRLNGINGIILLEATQLELESAGFTKLQIKKIFGCLTPENGLSHSRVG
jgi:hypothetical protein